MLLTITYAGQEIDFASNEAGIFNQQNGVWEERVSDLEHYSTMSVFGRDVRVETRDALIEYKQKLGREVDVMDVQALTILKAIS